MTDKQLLEKLVKGQEEIKAAQQTQGKTIADIQITQQTQDKTLKYIKDKLNKTAKTVDIIGLRYDERIVDNERRIDRIEDHLNLSAYKDNNVLDTYSYP